MVRIKCDHFDKVFTIVAAHNKDPRGGSYCYTHIILVIGDRAGGESTMSRITFCLGPWGGGKEDVGRCRLEEKMLHLVQVGYTSMPLKTWGQMSRGP